MIQWPELGTMPLVTSLATKRKSSAFAAPELLGAEGENRHPQLAALREQCFVIDCILIERGELLERILRGTWPRIETSVVRARLLVDGLRIGRQLIPAC